MCIRSLAWIPSLSRHELIPLETRLLNMKNYNLFLMILAAFIIGAASCTPIKKGEYAKGSATVFCDDGFKNILDEEIEVFEYSYPEASIIPFYVSETEAIDTLLADQTQAIIITHELTAEQIKYMKNKFKRVVRTNPIAVDAVALITNKENPIKALSIDDISKILNGKITHWSQLARNDTAAIKIVFDNAGSSTVSYMRNRFLDGRMISDNPNAYAQNTNAQVFDIVKKDPEALGIISVSWLGDELQAAKKVPLDKRMEDYANETDTIATKLTTEVNVIKVSNPTDENDHDLTSYSPYQLYINSGQYPLVRKVYMISTASNSTVLHSFYTFVTGFVGQKIISHTGIMPYRVHARVVNLL